jgi:two-component system chemotaxis response regulator CheB
MNKLRVLVVDDAVVVRRLLSDELAGDPALEVAGTAANGRIALAKIPQLHPDVVILDLEMAEMDGLQTLTALRRSHPRLPVIVFSGHGPRSDDVVVEALALGANDYVAKPEGGIRGNDARQCIHEQLIPRIKAFQHAALDVSPFAARPASERAYPSCSRVEVVAIGLSTGGPNALARLLPALPAEFPVPVVIVQHMPPTFTQMLADRLASRSVVSVREAVSGQPLRPGEAWLAPGDYHLVLARDGDTVRLRTHQGAPENSCRPSADVLFTSVAETYGSSALAVVLTGMGQDGLRGCERIREAGGQVLVQDEATSVVWGMPGFVARAGLADQILPLDQLAPEIIQRVRRGRSLSSSSILSR